MAGGGFGRNRRPGWASLGREEGEAILLPGRDVRSWILGRPSSRSRQGNATWFAAEVQHFDALARLPPIGSNTGQSALHRIASALCGGMEPAHEERELAALEWFHIPDDRITSALDRPHVRDRLHELGGGRLGRSSLGSCATGRGVGTYRVRHRRGRRSSQAPDSSGSSSSSSVTAACSCSSAGIGGLMCQRSIAHSPSIRWRYMILSGVQSS